MKKSKKTVVVEGLASVVSGALEKAEEKARDATMGIYFPPESKVIVDLSGVVEELRLKCECLGEERKTLSMVNDHHMDLIGRTQDALYRKTGECETLTRDVDILNKEVKLLVDRVYFLESEGLWARIWRKWNLDKPDSPTNRR